MYYSSHLFLSFFELFVLSLARPVLVPETKEVVSHKYKTPMVSHLLYVLVIFQRLLYQAHACGIWTLSILLIFQVSSVLLTSVEDSGEIRLWTISAWRERKIRTSRICRTWGFRIQREEGEEGIWLFVLCFFMLVFVLASRKKVGACVELLYLRERDTNNIWCLTIYWITSAIKHDIVHSQQYIRTLDFSLIAVAITLLVVKI